MPATSKTSAFWLWSILVAGAACGQAMAQAAIEFRVVPTDRNPASCRQWDAELARVHTFTPTGDGATLRTAGGINRNMTKNGNVYTTTLALGGTNFNVTADTSKSPKSLDVAEPRTGCRWSAVAP
ncbi:MAG TPA: hypothetical protein VGM96_13820 [Reyranella sp.]|jgi:hypothetical protein